ncbi:MAG: hypothetical protein LBL58_12945 [Tannerellaceae bacterium]|jgi:hypothetical protein|nr:hypothetical protein [Tannerellaceae bacterium]
MKHIAFALIGIIITMSSCSTYKIENTSVRNAVYILESVKDIPTGVVFSFRDYCAFNAERGAEDSILDKTLAEADARLELHFFDRTVELRLESSNESPAFLEYKKHYASRFFFTEDKNSVELTLRLDTLDEETRSAIEVMSDTERDAILKSVFKKSKDILIEPDEEDEVINYWRKAR